jgi:hypothetical protein
VLHGVDILSTVLPQPSSSSARLSRANNANADPRTEDLSKIKLHLE